MGYQLEQVTIGELLGDMASGEIQLPDFQRQYTWDDDRIVDLLLTVLRGHPMGVLMFLDTGGDEVRFKPKPVAGAAPAPGREPGRLLLDGQQRLTSLFQALTGDGAVATVDSRGQPITRRYFVDIEVASRPLDSSRAAVRSVPADGVVRAAARRGQQFEVATREGQFAAGFMPVTALFGPGGSKAWLNAWAHAAGPHAVDERYDYVDRLVDVVLGPVGEYLVPAIHLDKDTTREAVATVFEKVNTGGLPLDVFELLTATFAGDASYYREHGTDFRLGDDWEVTQQVLDAHPVLAEVRRTDVLQAVTLLATLDARRAHEGPGRRPAVSARREDVLGLELAAYLRWAPQVREALGWVAGFLQGQAVHTAALVPYRSQLVPLAVVRALLGPDTDHPEVHRRIERWFWCGVFGELYGGSTETRVVRDVEQVPAWAVAPLTGHEARVPDTLTARAMSVTRLAALRSRQSAAFRGVCALVVRAGARDWAGGAVLDGPSFAALQVDVHHVLPAAWCTARGVEPARRESVLNKTPLSGRTATVIAGRGPAEYLPLLAAEAGVTRARLDGLVLGHGIDPRALRAEDVDAVLAARAEALARLIEQATGREVVRESSGDPVADTTDTADTAVDPGEDDEDL